MTIFPVFTFWVLAMTGGVSPDWSCALEWVGVERGGFAYVCEVPAAPRPTRSR